jgi:hypothetical protein
MRNNQANKAICGRHNAVKLIVRRAWYAKVSSAYNRSDARAVVDGEQGGFVGRGLGLIQETKAFTCGRRPLALGWTR